MVHLLHRLYGVDAPVGASTSMYSLVELQVLGLLQKTRPLPWRDLLRSSMLNNAAVLLQFILLLHCALAS